MNVRRLSVPDFHDLNNALAEGPSVPGVVSFDIRWTPSNDRRCFHNEELQYFGRMVINAATCAWSGATREAKFVSDPASTSINVVAEVGRVKNGVFFPRRGC